MRVRTVSRLHMGLIDLNGELGRIDGGVGLALREPHIEVEAEPADETRATGPMADRVEEAAKTVVDEIRGDPVALTVTESYPQHVGLGSGTQASLAAAKLAAAINDVNISTRVAAKLTGRGGTSGIGTAAFDSGGFIVDGGHAREDKEAFLPSAASHAPPPPVVSRLEFPDWEIAVLLPGGTGAHGEEEVDVFEEHCPIPAEEVEKLSRLVLMKLLPAVAERDFESFREAVAAVQGTGFKRHELGLKPASEELVEEMHERGCAAGMSSFGPAVYAVHPEEVDVSGTDAEVYRTRASNGGAEVER